MWESDRGGVYIRDLRSRIQGQLTPLIPDSDDLEDVTQDCLIKAWQNNDSFRNESKHGSWVYRLVRNEFVSWLRRRDCRRRADREWAARVGQSQRGRVGIQNNLTRLHVSGPMDYSSAFR